ncbi:sodium-dependent transporter [Halomicrococcus sp. SG-WS-1]|uniref:sodium-dependent transporter n=1 Tax=Halomicrococcus sp. SG-WS-1 TaxID=3439057 RepID=UPI003F7AF797
MAQRETWASRVGFILAAVGSAVGLGNIWRFPYMTAEYGGAAFLVVYLIAAFGIGLPAMLAEFAIGRKAKKNVINAFEGIGYPAWQIIGLLGLVTGFWILSYYSVVGGWVIQYVIGTVQGAYFGNPEAYFGSISTGTSTIVFHAVFMALTVGIVALGVEDGIEAATKLMVPSILVILAGLAVWGSTLPGAMEGFEYFLNPNFDALMSNLDTIIPFAVGQAFFSLSLGMGVMITYASYLGKDDNLGMDGSLIVILNTSVGVLAGLVVFPLLYAQGVDPGSAGAGAVFISMATAFAELPGGTIIGLIFFLVVLVAALSSAISLLEVVVSYAVDNYAISRLPATAALGLVIFLLGLPSAMSLDTFGLYDTVANSLLLPLGVTLIVTFVGWVFAGGAIEELRQGTDGLGSLGPAWLWHVRTVVLIAVVGTLALSFMEFL